MSTRTLIIVALVGLAATAIIIGLLPALRSPDLSEYFHPDELDFLGSGTLVEGHEIRFVIRDASPTTHCPGALFTVDGNALQYRVVRGVRGATPPSFNAPAVWDVQNQCYRIVFPWDWEQNPTLVVLDALGRRTGSTTMHLPDP